MTYKKHIFFFNSLWLFERLIQPIAPLLAAALFGGGTSGLLGLLQGDDDLKSIAGNVGMGAGMGALTGGLLGPATPTAGASGALGDIVASQAGQQALGQEAIKQTFAQSMGDIAKQMAPALAGGVLQQQFQKMNQPSQMLNSQPQQIPQLSPQRPQLPTAADIMRQRQSMGANPLGVRKGYM